MRRWAPLQDNEGQYVCRQGITLDQGAFDQGAFECCAAIADEDRRDREFDSLNQHRQIGLSKIRLAIAQPDTLQLD